MTYETQSAPEKETVQVRDDLIGLPGVAPFRHQLREHEPVRHVEQASFVGRRYSLAAKHFARRVLGLDSNQQPSG